MTLYAALTQIAKLVAAGMERGKIGEGLRELG